MFIELKLGHDFQQTVNSLSRMGGDVLQAASTELGKGVELAASNVQANYLSGQALKVRSGLLRDNIKGWLASPFDGVVGVREKAAVDKYAWLLTDEQKTIRPTGGRQCLTIPIGEALTMAGTPKYESAKDAEEELGVKLFRPRGTNVLGYKIGKKGKFRPLFALVKSVLVQGSGALYDGTNECVDKITENIQAKIDERIGD